MREAKMWDLRKRLCSQISGGERKRAIIASALASEVEILLLDETTVGLDAIAKRSVLSSLRSLTADGRTIVLTTHNMEEAEIASDRLGIINKGRIICEGTPEEIKKSIGRNYRVVLNRRPNQTTGNGNDWVIFGDKCIVYVDNENEATKIVKDAMRNGLKATISPISLEDAFIRLVGESDEKDD